MAGVSHSLIQIAMRQGREMRHIRWKGELVVYIYTEIPPFIISHYLCYELLTLFSRSPGP